MLDSTHAPRRFVPILTGVICALLAATTLHAQQRIQFPTGVPQGPAAGGVIAPQPPATLGTQIVPFDPYAMPNVSASVGAPALPFPYAPPASTLPPTLAPGYGGPQVIMPPTNVPRAPQTVPVPPAANLPPILPPTFAPTQPPPPLRFGPTPQAPTAVFPNGFNWGNFGQAVGSGQYQRLIQDTGFDYTYLYGEKPTALQIHEVEIHTSLVIQNFAHSPNGLRVTPGFIFDFLDGPSLPDPAGADLPAQLYSAYLDTAWRPQLTPRFAGDVRVRTGVYSDFDTITWHSIRFTGHGLGVLQVTPTLAIKVGIEYLDRQRIKLLPAGGFLWTPNDKTIFDIYFPRPKLTQYWTTVRNTDVWWHLGGEYGGGSWTIDRLGAPALFAGRSQRIDINDLRAFAGINWKGLNERHGYLEVGYVFDREIIFKPMPLIPNESTSLDDTFMIRGGIGF